MTEVKPNIQLWDIARLVPYKNNVKKHDAAQVAKIAESIRRFKWTQPIVVDRDGVIINGHGRRLAAIELGLSQVPVWVRDDLTEEEVRAARLSDNRVALSDIDADMLQAELAGLNIDLSGIFDDKELEFLSADLGEMNDDAFVEDLEAEIAEQVAETKREIEATDVREVKIAKALGFTAIQGKDERVVARFMATAEAETGLTGADAFIAQLKKLAA
ncbi:ParB/Srx family N-terminal domain-containing protein [Ralstonia pickettii]|uniref:ParB/Srx family N-terminal domain-containing protein n=1 Tax=Ralstonia pickettii TaxID=329 RepID=UPI002714CBD2|nr:ParB/Srx family N-terminal domain-containing protein [Ralstonia pickettii]WKZ86322.1 ParB/Srx family N-terminal domain-containing protein [Ralstonia pickettii]